MGSARAGSSTTSNKSLSTLNSGNVTKRGSIFDKQSSSHPSGTHMDVDSQLDFRNDPNFSADSPEKGNTSLSIGGIFNIRRKKKRGVATAQTQDDPTAHELTFTITVSQAVPTDETEKMNPTAPVDREPTESSISKKKKTTEAPKPLQYFHYSYHLIPPDEGDEETMADVVTFPTAAKVYGKGAIVSENPGVKTWREGDKTWFSFQHNHKISVTKELLHKLFDHTLEVRVWNTKDKVSSTTRFDRPKAFRFPGPKPGEDPEDIGGVRPTVFNQSREFVSLQPKKYFSFRDDVYYSRRKDIYRMLPHEKLELEKKFADWAETNPDMVPKPPKGFKEDEEKRGSPSGEAKGLEESVYNLGSREESPSAKIPHTIVGYQRSGGELTEENMRTYSRLGRLAAASDRLDKPIVGGRTLSIASSKGHHTRRDSSGSRMSKRSVSIAPGAAGRKGAGVGATSVDRALDEKEAQYNKYGLTSVSVRMSMLFAGLRSVTNRLDFPVEDVSDMFVTISVDDDLLNEQQREALNPMSIKIESTTSMPNIPLSYSDLRKRCYPAFCRYKFGNLDWYKTPPKIQDRDIHWNDTNVVLLGIMDPAEVREIFRGGLFQVEVHDRDARKVKQEKPPALFGEEAEDDKISSIALVANKRTVHNAFESKSTWDPYGVAKFDLCDLLKGHKRISLKVQIQQGPLPDLLGLQSTNSGDHKDGGQVVGNPCAVDGPVDLPLPAGHYLECGSSMKLTIEVTKLLTTPAEVVRNEKLPASEKCHFTRMIITCDQSDQVALQKVFSKIREINSKALELTYLPQQSVPAALKTYRLSEEQKVSGECDVITGVHVLDGKFHLLLLEGLRSHGLNELFEHVHPKSNEQMRMRIVFDSDLMFSKREYSYFGASLYRVRIHEPLSSIMIQPLLYVRDMVPKLSFDCLTKIAQILESGNMKDITRNALFPTVDMIKSMSKEFGIAYFQESPGMNSPDKKSKHGDFKSEQTDMAKKSNKSSKATKSNKQQNTDYDFDAVDEAEEEDVVGKVFGSRMWTPLMMTNPEFELVLRDREVNRMTKNYLDGNKQLVEQISQNNRAANPKRRNFSAPVRSCESNGVFNYSSHTHNTTEVSLDEMREVLQSRYPGRLFTYMEEAFWNSGVFVPVNLDKINRDKDKSDTSKWMTPDGFTYPGMNSALEDLKHEKRLDGRRTEEIQSFVWRENTLHEGQLKPALPGRDIFKWDFRKHDMDLKKKPESYFGMQMPSTIMLSGDTKLEEERAAYDQLMKGWREKLLGRDPVLKFHRMNPATETIERGAKASNQLEKLKGLKKDHFEKKGVSARLSCDVPPLGVVHYPSVDKSARDAGFSPPPGLAQVERGTPSKGPFTLGDEEEKTVGNNVVSLAGRGAKNSINPDFKLINASKHPLYLKKIEQLKEEERQNYLFRASQMESQPTVQREANYPLVKAN